MKTVRHLAVVILAASSILVCPGAVVAQQVEPAQLQQALARAQGLLRQLAQQKGALEAEKAKIRIAAAATIPTFRPVRTIILYPPATFLRYMPWAIRSITMAQNRIARPPRRP